MNKPKILIENALINGNITEGRIQGKIIIGGKSTIPIFHGCYIINMIIEDPTGKKFENTFRDCIFSDCRFIGKTNREFKKNPKRKRG